MPIGGNYGFRGEGRIRMEKVKLENGRIGGKIVREAELSGEEKPTSEDPDVGHPQYFAELTTDLGHPTNSVALGGLSNGEVTSLLFVAELKN